MNALQPPDTPSDHFLDRRILAAGPDSRRMSDFIACLKHLELFGEPSPKTSRELLLRLEENAPDLVFLDLDLPGDPVPEVATQIREKWGLPVLFSGGAAALAKIPRSCLSLPFGYLATPYQPLELQRLVETALYAANLEKQAQQADQFRQDAEARYHLLADNVSDVIFTMDLNLRYTYVSPSMKRVRGYEPEELIGKTILDMVTPESRNELISRFESHMQLEASGAADPRRVQMLETEVYRKDGTTVWIESRVSFLRDEHSRPVGVIGINREITERRNMVDQLRESEEKFRALAERCPFAILIYQNDYWVYVNPAAEAISGYLREEFYRMRFWEIVHPDYRPLVRDRGNQRQAGQVAPPVYDFKIVHKTGRVIWVSLSGSSLMYQGKPAGFITIIDISERKMTEAALMKSEARYRTILQSIEEAYFEVDLHGNFTFFNDKLCHFSGYAKEDMLGENYRRYMDTENAGLLRDFFYRISGTGDPSPPVAFSFFQKDGNISYLELTASLLKDDTGKPSGFRGVARDITDRVRAEKHRQKLEAQLRHAQKMEAIGTLAGGIAHDFNNILQAINGYAQLLLLDKPAGHPDAKKLGQIREAGERAGRLIQQLLTFSRKMEGRPRLLCLNHEVRQAEDLLRQMVPKMITIKLTLDTDLRKVAADPLHIEQILLNLGSNAADAMPDGGCLSIETRNVELDRQFCKEHVYVVPGSYVLLTVSDTGVGMNATTAAHIFDPFFTTKAAGKGTGMGLASVYGIVKNLEGYILCHSEPDKGSAFDIYLPVAAETESHDDEAMAEMAPRGGTETILVVDDEAAIRETAGEMLTHYGYTVLLAENGEAALEIFRYRKSDIRLVIMDISMPGMGGYQCLREMRAEHPTAKIIIASGYATTEHAREATELGASGFIGKPYRIDDMIATVREVLDQV